LFNSGATTADGKSLTVRDIMKLNPTSVSSMTPTLEAIELMRRAKIGCLPIVDDGQLVGIVTSYDFLTAAACLFKLHLTEPPALADRSAKPQAVSARSGSTAT
jgi:signal-transduction protein with cAMP-binding, CBS, and nucleotidyltransferase domain